MGPKSRSVAAPKSPSLPLEHDRALPADPRDPRSQSTWPCNGSHKQPMAATLRALGRTVQHVA